ncbi:MAG: bile acid-coenzyme ligase [Acidimicrobiaceae bacterium]|jgi:bile acid-coenzyme A ligase
MSDEESYGAVLTRLAAERGDEAELIFVPTEGAEREVTFAELERRANQIARGFADRVGEGDVVAIVLPTCVEHLLVTLATWKLGGTVLPLRHDLPLWELERLLALAEAKVVVAPEAGDGLTTLADLAATADLDASPLPDRVAECTQLIASSGSTGTPKLIVAPARGVLAGDAQATVLGVGDAQQVTLVVSPLYHVNGFAFAAPGLLEGSRVILMERFDAARAVELVERHRVTYTVMVPTMLQRIARLPDVSPARLATLDRVVYGGATIPDWLVERWLELIPPDRFLFAYGSSERLVMCAMTGAEWRTHPGATGRPTDAELRIVGPDGRELPAGEVGDIYVRPFEGRSLFRYIGSAMPEPTADGFMTIGDMGYVDADGYLSVVDRRHDLIVTGGANVFPAEVEAALSEHPEVADQVVVGVPDAEWGRRVHAIIQPRVAGAPPTDDDLREHCRDRLAAYKVPKSFEVLEQLPRTSAGKINRTKLADDRS